MRVCGSAARRPRICAANVGTVSGAAVGLSWGAVEYRRGAAGANVSGRGRGIGARGCASADLRRGVRGSAARTSAQSAARRSVCPGARRSARSSTGAARCCARGSRTANVGTVSGAAYSRRGEVSCAVAVFVRSVCAARPWRVCGASWANVGTVGVFATWRSHVAPQRKAARFLIVFCAKRGGGGGRGAATSPGSSPRPI